MPKTRMKIVAVLGKYYVPKRGADGNAIVDSTGCPVPDFNAMENNRRLAEILHAMLWSLPGVEVGGFCAHMNTRRFELLTDAGETRYQEFDRQMIERAVDAAILIPNWRDSQGTLKEIELMDLLDRPVFEELESLNAWLQEDRQRFFFRKAVKRIGSRRCKITYWVGRTARALTLKDLWSYHRLDGHCIPRPA